MQWLLPNLRILFVFQDKYCGSTSIFNVGLFLYLIKPFVYRSKDHNDDQKACFICIT